MRKIRRRYSTELDEIERRSFDSERSLLAHRKWGSGEETAEKPVPEPGLIRTGSMPSTTDAVPGLRAPMRTPRGISPQQPVIVKVEAGIPSLPGLISAIRDPVIRWGDLDRCGPRAASRRPCPSWATDRRLSVDSALQVSGRVVQPFHQTYSKLTRFCPKSDFAIFAL